MSHRALLIEDAPNSRSLHRIALEALGFEVRDLLSDPTDALRLMTVWQPDLLLIDWHTTQLDSRAFLRAIRTDAHVQRMTIVVLSTPPMSNILSETPFIDYHLLKPVQMTDLVRVVQHSMSPAFAGYR